MSDSLSNSIVIKVRYGELDDVFIWCVDNCAKKWNLVEIESLAGIEVGVYHFRFEDEDDMVIFSLRWA